MSQKVLGLFFAIVLFLACDDCSEPVDAVELPRVEDSEKMPVEKGLDLYLLMGQSNMAGRGVVEDEDMRAHPPCLDTESPKRMDPRERSHTF